MIRKILLLGMILILSSACLPHLNIHPEKNQPDLAAAVDEQPSLFTPSELETLLSCDLPPLQMKETSLSAEGNASHPDSSCPSVMNPMTILIWRFWRFSPEDVQGRERILTSRL